MKKRMWANEIYWPGRLLVSSFQLSSSHSSSWSNFIPRCHQAQEARTFSAASSVRLAEVFAAVPQKRSPMLLLFLPMDQRRSIGQTAIFKPANNERLIKFECYLFRQTTLMKFQLRSNNNYWTTRTLKIILIYESLQKFLINLLNGVHILLTRACWNLTFPCLDYGTTVLIWRVSFICMVASVTIHIQNPFLQYFGYWSRN